MLRTKGCLQLDNSSKVVYYEDKPVSNVGKYDGYWCAFAFKREVFDSCIAFMEQSTLKSNQLKLAIEDTAIFKSKTLEVEDYKDLGTWDEIGKILRK